VKIGPYDYSLYTNSQLADVRDINMLPLKTIGFQSVRVADVGQAKDAEQIQYNIVRVDGQPSVYLPVLKQGGDTNTIAVVDGIKSAVSRLVDIPKSLVTSVVFDQSIFVKQAIDTLVHEGSLGLFLTSLMILVFLGNFRATAAVFLSIPLSVLATFAGLWMGGGTVNTMVLGGLALVFSRVIDNSVVVLENIFRHLELGESARDAAEKGGREVAVAVLAATLATAVVFFPVAFLYGVSKFLFTALAAAVILALFASYLVAMTVVPLFCAKLLKGNEDYHEDHLEHEKKGWHKRFNLWFNRQFERMLDAYSRVVRLTLKRPGVVVAGLTAMFLASLLLYPMVSVAFFPRTDAGQFVINVKAPSGTRLEMTEQEVAKVENVIRRIVSPEELGMIVSNIGVTPDISAIYTSNSAPHTGFVQVSLKEDHKTGS
jgi:multidrug efflux pump subunit AcrB